MVVVCFGSILLVVSMWYERNLRPEHGRGLTGGNLSQTQTFQLESIDYLSPIQGLHRQK